MYRAMKLTFVAFVHSDTALLSIPELEFDMQPGTLEGRFTTIEGLLVDIKDQLSTHNPFVTRDSTSMNKPKQFVKKLDDVSLPMNIANLYSRRNTEVHLAHMYVACVMKICFWYHQYCTFFRA